MEAYKTHLYSGQVAYVYKHMPESFAANVANSCILTFILWKVANHTSLLIWLACLIGISILRLFVYLRFKRSAIQNPQFWGRLFIAGIAMSGLIWGGAGVLFFPVQSPTHQIFIAFVLGGMVVGASISSSAILGAFFSYCILSLIPITLIFFTFEDVVHIGMGIMCVIFTLITMSISYRIYTIIRSSIILSYNNMQEINVRRKAEHILRSHQSHLEKIVKERTHDLAVINEMFVNLTSDPQHNIDLIVNHACKLLQGVACLYNRLDDQNESLVVWSAAQAPGDLPQYDAPEGHICYEATIKGQDQPVILNDLQGTVFEETDVNVKKYGLRSYLGYPVQLQNRAIGALCIVDVKPREFTNTEIQIISTLAKAVSLEEERKIAEEEKENLAIQLRQAQKMEAIGTLAGGIAHDFNNILSAIIGYTEIAKLGIAESSPVHKDLDEVLKAGNRAKELVQQILTFSRKSQQQLKPIQPHMIVTEALKFLRASIPTSIELEQDVDSDCGLILSDPTQLQQVVVNLCTNAFQAMEVKGGVLRVELKPATISTVNAHEFPVLTRGKYVKLSVSDTGSGIDKAWRERIFEPYFTTKEQGKGTGMGLAVVLGIVQGYGGTIVVDSKVGEGSRFDIYIPQIEGNMEQQETALDESLPTGTEKVMVIDDEQSIALLNKRNLESLGYRVDTFTNSVEAFEDFKSHADDFDLIITDQTMPQMTGSELATQLLKIRPDIPIILLTGYSSSVSMGKAKEIGIRDFLMKPADRKKMAYAVRKVLDEDRN